jgi:methanogenic corrinoid protein MtbC1
MSQQVLHERFFSCLVEGDRHGARAVVDECLAADAPAEIILEKLFWPVYETVQRLHREDQLSIVCHHFATRLMRMLTDQMQVRLTTFDRNGRRILLVGGPREGDELAGQIAADLLEARGYEVFFAGGGVANDEVMTQLARLKPHALVLFGNAPADLPHIRQLIDELHGIGMCPDMQIVVGGGVFNRAEGLAEEIGADLWAATPLELVRAMDDAPQQRMSDSQRTVGRHRKTAKAAAA